MNISIYFGLIQLMLLGLILALNKISHNNDLFYSKALKQGEEVKKLLQILINK